MMNITKPWESSLTAPDIRLLKKTFPRSFGVEIECGIDKIRKIKPDLFKTGVDFHQKQDLSIRIFDKFVREYTLRINSYLDLKKLYVLCDRIRTYNGVVNHTCGLHVHIGIGELEACTTQQKELFFQHLHELYYTDEDFVNKICSRVNDQYALIGMSGFDELSARYYAINRTSYFFHGTVEFRQMEGTVSYDRILTWVMFLQRIVNDAFLRVKQTDVC